MTYAHYEKVRKNRHIWVRKLPVSPDTLKEHSLSRVANLYNFKERNKLKVKISYNNSLNVDTQSSGLVWCCLKSGNLVCRISYRLKHCTLNVPFSYYCTRVLC